MKALVDSQAFMDQLAADIGVARRSVCVQTMSFEGDAAGRRLAALLLARPDLERTLIVDRYSLFHLSDRFLLAPWNAVRPALWRELRDTLRLAAELRRAGVQVHWTNPVGVLFLQFVGRNHKKLVLVDDRIAYVGGLNVCDHNFDWHDVMLRIDDERVGAFLREDVRATLRGEDLPRRGQFDGVDIILLDGADNPRLWEPVFQLIRHAQRSIVIESPYLSFPFYERLAEAVRRGISVVVIAPEHNNKPKMNAYTQWAAGRAGVTLRLYAGRMSHLKAMVVDDDALVIGSPNFDFLSYETQQEIVAIVRDRSVVEQFRKDVIEADLARSVEPTRPVSDVWQAWRDRGFRGGARALIAMHRAYAGRPTGWK